MEGLIEGHTRGEVREGAVVARIGEHVIAFRRPCTVHLAFCGDVREAEAQELHTFLELHTGQLPLTLYIVELHRLGRFPVEAQRALARRFPDLVRPAVRSFRLAFTGANLRTRVLVSLTIAAAQITAQENLSTKFFDSVAEALAWARTTRALL